MTMIYKYCTNKHYKTHDNINKYLLYVAIIGVMIYMLTYTVIVQLYR